MAFELSEGAGLKICNHMNEDHADAVGAMARFYGPCHATGTGDASNAKMVGITSRSLRLQGAAFDIDVPFKEPLKSRGEARAAIIEMAKIATDKGQFRPTSMPITAIVAVAGMDNSDSSSTSSNSISNISSHSNGNSNGHSAFMCRILHFKFVKHSFGCPLTCVSQS